MKYYNEDTMVVLISTLCNITFLHFSTERLHKYSSNVKDNVITLTKLHNMNILVVVCNFTEILINKTKFSYTVI